LRFRQLFILAMVVALAGAFLVPPSLTSRAQGKADVLLYPVVKPVRSIAAAIQRRFGGPRPLPPGETKPRADADLSAENAALRQQVTFLIHHLEELKLVEADRKRLGPLLNYFKPVTVVGADSSPGRESLSLMPASGVDTGENTPVMWAEGFAGRMVAGGRVRLVTDRGFKITAEFGRFGENAQWLPIPTAKASVTGIGDNTMRVDHLTIGETEGLQPGDIVVVADPDFPETSRDLVQHRPLGQIESIKPQAGKPLYSEIIIKPRADLRKLGEVLLLRENAARKRAG
jgi:cell shape-determining protein MreC